MPVGIQTHGPRPVSLVLGTTKQLSMLLHHLKSVGFNFIWRLLPIKTDTSALPYLVSRFFLSLSPFTHSISLLLTSRTHSLSHSRTHALSLTHALPWRKSPRTCGVMHFHFSFCWSNATLAGLPILHSWPKPDFQARNIFSYLRSTQSFVLFIVLFQDLGLINF